MFALASHKSLTSCVICTLIIVYVLIVGLLELTSCQNLDATNELQFYGILAIKSPESLVILS